MRYYTGIGSRKTSVNVLEFMSHFACLASKRGFVLRSGGAKGADSAFDLGYPSSEIYKAHHADQYPWCYESVDRYHPAPDRLNSYVCKLMARNALQVLGYDGKTPSKFVICWTPNGSGSGGTGQALRIAKDYNIPIYDLGNVDIWNKLTTQYGRN